MTRHFPELGSVSDWLNQISHATRPIRRTTQIWVVTCHQYEISTLVSRTSFGGSPSPVKEKPLTISFHHNIIINRFFVHHVFVWLVLDIRSSLDKHSSVQDMSTLDFASVITKDDAKSSFYKFTVIHLCTSFVRDYICVVIHLYVAVFPPVSFHVLPLFVSQPPFFLDS